MARLRQWGVEPQRITASGIPVHPKWTQLISRQEILSQWNLPADKRIILLSGGTKFTCAPVTQIARDIAEQCPQAYVVVLCGNNKKLLERVAKLSRTKRSVVGVSYTDRLHELAGVCSLMITKAGGVTTAECLAKAVPMLLLKPVPGQEASNAEYFERQGAAVIIRGAADAASQAAQLLQDDRALASLADNARRLYRNASGAIVNEVCQALSMDYLRQGELSDRSRAPSADVSRPIRS